MEDEEEGLGRMDDADVKTYMQMNEARDDTGSKSDDESAEMNQQAGKVRIVGRDKEKEMLARLSWLLLDAGTTALKHTFDSIHPPTVLNEHLAQSHVKVILQRLHSQKVIDDKHWRLIYPVKDKQAKQASSYKFDSRILATLLETICHLCPPYPNGWSQEPQVTDTSLSADIVRLKLMFMELTRHDTIPGELYAVLFSQIREVLIRLTGPPIRIKLARIEQELISLELQTHYIQTLRDTWKANIARKLDKMHEARTRVINPRKIYNESKGVALEGLSPEDKVTLTRTYKLFVDNVPAEDVLDRLQQSQVIKFSDRQEILSLDKSTDRIQLLLQKVMASKLPYALKALIDAIKFKYKKVYEQVVHVRKITHKEGVVTKIDTVGLSQEALRNYYRNKFGCVFPFPWSDTIHASIRDIFTPLEIIDDNGNKVHQIGLLPTQSGGDHGLKILLEGASGSGKTLLCAWISYMWAVLPEFFRNKYEQVLYLNAVELKGKLETALYREFFPDNFKLNKEQVWEMLETKSREVLILLDGFDQSDSFDVSEILSGTRLRHSTVIMAVNPNNFSNKSFVPDRKWLVLGFNEGSIRRCLKTCITASRMDHEPFERLYKLIFSDKFSLRENLALPIFTVNAFAIFSILKRRGILKEMKTECDILEKYGGAMASLYCKRNKIDVIGFEFPDEILGAVEDLERFAYNCLIVNRHMFTEEEVLHDTQNPIVLKLGAFAQFTQGSKLRFPCGVIRDFLAAKHLADMAYEDLEKAILEHKMVKLPKYSRMMSFLCGQYRNDYDTPVLRMLFEHLAARNEYCVRGNHIPDERNEFQPSPTTVVIKKDMSRGTLSDFKTSLLSLCECPERAEALETVALSFPTRLVVKIDGVLMLQMVEGLQLVLGFPDCPVSEIIIDLNPCHYSQLNHFLPLATAVGRKETIQSLKITWSSLDMMAKFLAGVTTNSMSLETVILTEDINKRSTRRITAATWAALQSACSNMSVVKKLAFLGGSSTAVLNHVLQHIPRTISYLDLTGCSLNLMCAGEISCRLHGNMEIEFLDLSYTQLNSANLVAIVHGLQLCESIRHVCLRGITFDRAGVIALSEFLRLTHSLNVLDLSDCQLTTDMCLRLVAGMRQNRSLTKVVLKNTEVTSEGRRMFTRTKHDKLHFEGLPDLGPLPLY